MTFTPKPFQRPAPHITRADVPLEEVEREIARNHLAARAELLDYLLAHPELAAMAAHATDGDLAEYRHLLYDADPDATVPAFPYPTTPKETS